MRKELTIEQRLLNAEKMAKKASTKSSARILLTTGVILYGVVCFTAHEDRIERLEKKVKEK